MASRAKADMAQRAKAVAKKPAKKAAPTRELRRPQRQGAVPGRVVVPAAPPLTKPGASSPPREGRDWAHLADTATVPLSNKERKALEKLENMALRAKATSTGAAGSRAGLRRQGGQGCF